MARIPAQTWTWSTRGPAESNRKEVRFPVSSDLGERWVDVDQAIAIASSWRARPQIENVICDAGPVYTKDGSISIPAGPHLI
jgi:hypothetical protein